MMMMMMIIIIISSTETVSVITAGQAENAPCIRNKNS